MEQCRWQPATGWDEGAEPKLLGDKANLVIFFTSKAILEQNPIIAKLKEYYPKAEVIGCANMGQIYKQKVTEEALVITAIQFECSEIKVVSAQTDNISKSEELGADAISKLPLEGLRHVFAISDGVETAGSPLVKGLRSKLTDKIGLTGGFARDSIYHNGVLPLGSVVAVGFYGDHLKFGYAAAAGWKSYGMVRKVTKSAGETLLELDGKPALDLYKEFLGPFASELPGIGLLYPMSIWEHKDRPQDALARTIIGVDEQAKSLQFAGDIPEGYNSQFMITNNDMLVRGATDASVVTLKALQDMQPELALLMTCISRKLVMKQRIEEEIESVADVLGKDVVYVGFYTWGEISPIRFEERCYFQNQVMAVTGIREDVH